MSFCPNCGAQLNPGFSFCPNCGFKVASINSRGISNTDTPPFAPSSEQMDLVDKYLSLKPGVVTYESFISEVEIKGDIIAISSALDSVIKPAAQSGEASAMIVLGVLHEKGFAVEQSREKAFDYFGEATDKGYPVAEWIAGLIDMEADSHFALFWDLNLSRGFQSFIESANQGYCPAMVNLGNCCSEGKGTAQNKSEALKWYRKAADLGYAPAQHKLGRCYHGLEEGFAINYPEALKWYSKAASQGYAPSQNNLGYCFYEGQGVPKDSSEAARWYRKAAEQGLAIAQKNLGYLYYSGNGINQDFSEAVNWFLKAANQGNAEGQYWLGRCHEWGYGVASKLSEAMNWYRSAAEQGHVDALIAVALHSGDNAEAIKRLHEAIEQGNGESMYWMGRWYETSSRGLPKDDREAAKWYRKAIENGYNCKEALDLAIWRIERKER